MGQVDEGMRTDEDTLNEPRELASSQDHTLSDVVRSALTRHLAPVENRAHRAHDTQERQGWSSLGSHRPRAMILQMPGCHTAQPVITSDREANLMIAGLRGHPESPESQLGP